MNKLSVHPRIPKILVSDIAHVIVVGDAMDSNLVPDSVITKYAKNRTATIPDA